MQTNRVVKSSKIVKFKIKDGNKTIGRAFLYIIKNDLHKNSYGLLEDLFVAGRYRGKGLGTKLLQAVILEARKRKLYKLIGTSRLSRPEVHRFYLKGGFKKYGYEFRLDLKGKN